MEAHPQIFTTTTATLTDSRGTWLVGHACGRDAAAAAAAAASPPHVSEFGGACVCVCVCGCGCGCVCVCGCVCGCAACVDAYAETWSGGEKRGYGGCVLVPFSCSIHHHHHHHLHVPRPLHAHARTVAVYAECCALAPSFIPPRPFCCCRFSSPSSHLLLSLVTQCRCLLASRILTCAATPPRLCKQVRWCIVSMYGVG